MEDRLPFGFGLYFKATSGNKYTPPSMFGDGEKTKSKGTGGFKPPTMFGDDVKKPKAKKSKRTQRQVGGRPGRATKTGRGSDTKAGNRTTRYRAPSMFGEE
jgi:hypothetical protein